MLPILFSSYETGAPVLNNGAGSMISVLDACLVTGFNSKAVASLTVAGNVCTAVTTLPHGYAVDQRVTHAGATAPALVGSFAVASVPSTTSYTFPVTTANVTDTTGGMTAVRTPLGWLKEFTGTNKAVYKMSDPQSYGQRLRVVDDAAAPTCSRVMGVEFPTTVDAFADKFPTEAQLAGGGFWGKGANTAAAKFWCIVGDERCFYFVVEAGAYTGAYASDFAVQAYFFGDPISIKQAEGFGALILAGGSANGLPCTIGAQGQFGAVAGSAGDKFARQHTGITKSVTATVVNPSGSTRPGGGSMPNYPSSVDNGVVFTEPSFITEELPVAGNPIRAVLPGFVTLLGKGTNFPNVLGPNIITTTDGRNQKLALFHKAYHNGAIEWALLLKLSVDWRA